MSYNFKKNEPVTTGSKFFDCAVVLLCVMAVLYLVMFGAAVIATLLCAIGVSPEIAGIVYIVLYIASIMSGFVFDMAFKASEVVIKGINAVTNFDYSFGLWDKFKAA